MSKEPRKQDEEPRKPGGEPRKQDLSETSPMDPNAVPPEAAVNGGVPQPIPKPADGAEPPLGEGGNDKRSTTNIDTIIGRIVVDQGIATSEELQHVLELQRQQAESANQRTIGDLLIEMGFATNRQLERVRVVAEAERTGQQIPGYKILGKLGAGAMATVFKARQLSLDRLVAVKVLPKRYNSNVQFIERFYQEGRSAALLNHPNIVQAYDVGKAGDFHYFVMEYVDGRTVYDDIVKSKRFAEKDAIDVILQIAEALGHAHEKGIIHRDVKPKNIMLTSSGVAKLADMGLARAISDKEAAEAEQGKAFGTPYYISPEQIRGEKVIGPQADIYSLGATLYHMVVGRVPFDGKNPTSVMQQHLKGELVAPDHVNPKLSAGISEVIEMMMAKDPRKRYRQCKDLMADLQAVRKGQPPPIAHQDLGGADLGSLLKAEAAAPVQIQTDTAAAGQGEAFWRMMFMVMLGLLVLSVLVNIFLTFRGG